MHGRQVESMQAAKILEERIAEKPYNTHAKKMRASVCNLIIACNAV
ncbi:MAG: hypothetical protein QXU75_08970 [Candidatus Methanomethylicaceae archaeon]